MNHFSQLDQLKQGQIQPKDVGFRENSVLNQSKFYHCTENFSFDPMHDILEGVVPMCIKHVLKYFIVEKKNFTVDYLNERIHSFDYGLIEKKNKPSANFTIAMLNSSDNSIKQYAIQSWTLLRALPFLIYEKVSFTHSQHMHLLYLVEKIIEIVFTVEISKHMLLQLEEYIYSHDRLFMTLFPQISKINKFHHLSHYVTSIEQIGPMALNSCLRYETKHQFFKKQFQASGNFKNVIKSIADRQIFKQNVYLLNDIKVASEFTTTSSKFIPKSKSLAKEFLPEDINIIQKCLNLTVNSIKYQNKSIIQLPTVHSIFPKFGKILEIVKYNNNICFLCSMAEVKDYNESLNAFEIQEFVGKQFINFNEIIDLKPMSLWQIKDDTRKFIKIKTFIF